MSGYLTLSKLQAMIREGIDNAHPLPYWIAAEVSEIKVNSYSGHCYLELVEKGGDNHVPRAKVSGVMWRSNYEKIVCAFRAGAGVEITPGIRLLVKAVVNYHELYGLSLQIVGIDPSYTLGDMERQRRETIDRLRQEGVFDMNRELELPVVVQRLAVVSSSGAAGYRDFINELSQSPYRFETTLFDAFMQGAGAEDSIIEALAGAAARMEEFDAMVLIRGGGSVSDLGCFDSYRLSSHLAQFPLPVITGIGHDKDTSVADMVAILSLKTPTAAADYLVDKAARFDSFLQESLTGLEISWQKRLGVLLFGLDAALNRLSGSTKHFLSMGSLKLDTLKETLSARSRRLLLSQTKELSLLAGVVGGRDPERILERGFSILRKGGKTVSDPSELVVGDDIEVITAIFSVEAKVTGVK